MFGIVGVLAVIVLLPILREKYVLHKIWTNPRFKELKRCKLIDYSFDVLENDQLTFINQYTRNFKSAMFSFVDTVSKFNITYSYDIYVYLDGANVTSVLLDNNTSITINNLMSDIITRVENDSALAVLIKNTDVESCRFNQRNFVYTGEKDIIKFHINFGIAFFKLRNPTPELSSIQYVSSFLKTVSTKGFTAGDFDSLTCFRYVEKYMNTIYEIWRMQGFTHHWKDDFCEISKEGDEPVRFRWHTRRDPIVPILLEPLILSELRATGLPESYRRNNLVLNEIGASRYADYHKSGDKVIDASRIVGYYRYRWHTGTWIDELADGLQLKVFFTYYMDKKKLEMVRIGFSAANFYDGIALHPLKSIIDFNEIKKINPELNNADLAFKINQQGDVVATFIHDWHRYEINIETGTIKKEKYRYGGMRCIEPEDRAVYSSAEYHVHSISH